jgi:hypothetical protein
MSIDERPTPTPEERRLAMELAVVALAQVAPEELEDFDEISEEYFADPDAALAIGGWDQPLAFGGEIALLTPYVLTVAVPVVQWLGGLLADGAKEAATPWIAERIRSTIRKRKGSEPEQPPTAESLSLEHGRTAWQITYDRLRASDLPDDQARLIADSVLGALVVGR